MIGRVYYIYNMRYCSTLHEQFVDEIVRRVVAPLLARYSRCQVFVTMADYIHWAGRSSWCTEMTEHYKGLLIDRSQRWKLRGIKRWQHSAVLIITLMLRNGLEIRWIPFSAKLFIWNSFDTVFSPHSAWAVWTGLESNCLWSILASERYAGPFFSFWVP